MKISVARLRKLIVELYDEKLAGGLSSGMSPKDFDPDQLKVGIKIEMEHTSDRALAREIAMDHLAEDPDYYRKLQKIEKKAQTDDEEEICRTCGGNGIKPSYKPAEKRKCPTCKGSGLNPKKR